MIKLCYILKLPVDNITFISTLISRDCCSTNLTPNPLTENRVANNFTIAVRLIKNQACHSKHLDANHRRYLNALQPRRRKYSGSRRQSATTCEMEYWDLRRWHARRFLTVEVIPLGRINSCLKVSQLEQLHPLHKQKKILASVEIGWPKPRARGSGKLTRACEAEQSGVPAVRAEMICDVPRMVLLPAPWLAGGLYNQQCLNQTGPQIVFTTQGIDFETHSWTQPIHSA